MHEFSEEYQQNHIIDCLTEYLQYFKTVFSAQLGLIQSFIIETKSIHNNPTFVISKIQNKKYDFPFQHSPFQVFFQEKDNSSIERFYLRINQFLEYRFSPLRNVHNQSIILALTQFHKKLNQLFKQISFKSSKIKKTISLGNLFQKIEQKVGQFIYSLLNLVTKIKKAIFLANELIEESYKLIQNKFSRLFKNLANNPKNGEQTYKQQEKIKKIQKFISSQRKFEQINKISLINRNSSNTSFKNAESLQEYEINHIGSQFGNQSLNSYLKKEEYHRMLDVMDLQPNGICSKEYMLKQLIEKNKKNNQLIVKFIKKYKNKINNRRKVRQYQIDEKYLSKQISLMINSSTDKYEQYQKKDPKIKQKQCLNNFNKPTQNIINFQNYRINRQTTSKQILFKQKNHPVLNFNSKQISQKSIDKNSFTFKQIEKNSYQQLKTKLFKSNKDQQIIFKKHVSMKGKHAIKLEQSKLTLIQSAIKNNHFICQNSSISKIKHSVSNSILIQDQKFPLIEEKDKIYVSQIIEGKKIRQKSTPNKKQKNNTSQYINEIINTKDIQALKQHNLFIHLPQISQPKRKILSQK